MGVRGPIEVHLDDLSSHPAVRAWSALHSGAEPESVEVWREGKEGDRSRTSLYRLTFVPTEHPAVFAKAGSPSKLGVECLVYQDILPHLGLTMPAFHGLVEGEDGRVWLFVEDVGNEPLLVKDRGQRLLASRWLGMMHRSAQDVEAVARLPDAGPARYLAHVRSAERRIQRNLGNPKLTREERAFLIEILHQLAHAEARWERIEKACEGYPCTLVHGDFRPKNVRLRAGEDGPALYPIDWEKAGWGIPAADLAPARDSGPLVEPEVYVSTVRVRWPELDAQGVLQMCVLGQTFRALAAIDWACAGLDVDSRLRLGSSLADLRSFKARLAAAERAAAEWEGSRAPFMHLPGMVAGQPQGDNSRPA